MRRFLGLRSDALKLLKAYDVRYRSFSVLCHIVEQHINGVSLTVSDVIGQKSIASPAKLHSDIRHLVESGLVISEVYAGDRRIRYLVPTEKCLKMFDALEALVI